MSSNAPHALAESGKRVWKVGATALRLDRGQGRSAARDHAMRASFSAP